MLILLTIALLGLLVRVAQLQAHTPAPVARMLDTQQSKNVLLGRRGALLDRRGRFLAVTRVASRLFVDPALIIDRNMFSERVGYGLDYDPIDIEKRLAGRSRGRYVVIDPRLSDERLDRYNDMELLPGLATEPVLVRDYPYGSLASQVIGFVGTDGKGLEGLEMISDSRLAAQPGELRYLRDARGQPLFVEADRYEPSCDGRNIRLSIDAVIQAIAEKQLSETIAKYGAESGQIVVMQPFTGEILAMANYPTFDPDAVRTSDAALRRNRAVTDVFEPGSIFKPVVWSILTEQGLARPSEMIDCTTSGLYVSPKGRRLRDAHGHGVINWDQVLVLSSNIGMAIVGQRAGEQKLYDAVRTFGFGSPTGSGLPGEIGGIVNPLKKWNHYSVTSVPMGQEIGVTALQMVRAFCTFANDGLLVTPTMYADDADSPEPTAAPQRILSSAAASYTRQILRRVITEGTGRKADSKLYSLFGKTGTAQLPNFKTGGYYQDQYVASFVAGAPADSPRLVVGCFIQKPDKSKGHYGGSVAAPPVMKVIEDSLLYLGVTPQPTRPRDIDLVALTD
jgi:cell division protein FtsI (penicillin-binding protein 3)